MEDSKIGFELLALKTEQFATFEEHVSEVGETEIFTELEFKIDKENKQVGVFTDFTFYQAKQTFLKIQISCHFEILSRSWEVFSKEEKIVFPKSFMGHLAMLTIGSARGVLHAKTEGTIFNKFLLPTINVDNLVTEDIDFELP